jgi:hypothetical protein
MTLSRREMIAAIASGVAPPAIAASHETSQQIKYPGPTTINSALLDFLSVSAQR